MRIPGVGRLWRQMRRLRHVRARGGLILMYHRVAEGGTDPWGLCVSPRHFAEHLDVLTRSGRVLSLRDIAARGSLSRNAVALTFDDGYADNLLAARPLLERAGTPATVFVASGGTTCRGEFWWDELDHLFLQPGMLPDALRLCIGGAEYAWTLGTAAHYSERTALEHRDWRAWEEPPTPRHATYLEIWERLYLLTDAEKQRVLSALREWAGAAVASRPSHRLLTPDELVTMADGELVEIGGHTVTHPALATQPVPLQRAEIREGKAALEAMLDRPVSSFSYPHGHYTPETVAEVRAAGFRIACTAVPEPVAAGTDPLTLPRVQVPDVDGEAFGRQLAAWYTSEAHGD